MDYALTNKRALVTGSSSGLGAATAKMLAAEGAAVVVHGRDKERADAVAEPVVADGGRADVAIGDLTTDEGADAVVAGALANGPVGILVNNAGSYRNVSWDDATAEDWSEAYETNVISARRRRPDPIPLIGSGVSENRRHRVTKVKEIMEKSTHRANLRRVRLPGTVAPSGRSRASGGQHFSNSPGEQAGASGEVVGAETLVRTPCTAQAMTTAC
ncbi:SDR family NAD(P)-dependent oxidoreductase [Streptomyces sp. NPDC059582]|uniref:SDR family NAD(P)-dependent oxidoreductase n=1 Tax=Streptomyces sp. NPDC059582 TaxID=3346875 RepID=UPI0036B633B1